MNDVLLANYTKGLTSGSTRRLFTRYATDFLTYAQGNFDRQTIDAYMTHLKKSHHYADGTVNLIFRVIRTLYKRNEKLLESKDIEWPFAHGDSPQIREDSINAPALDPELVMEMIDCVKQSSAPELAAFMALSTTYGLRRDELVNMTAEDIHIKDCTIHIATAKHGRERTHLIPQEILPWLERYDFSIRMSNFTMLNVWWRIEQLAGFAHIPRVGFHSVRRTLNSVLVEHLPEITVMSFLRWKQRTSSNMPYRYSAQKFVGRGGESTKVIGETLRVDQKVFTATIDGTPEGPPVHPFVTCWGQKPV